MIGEITVKNVKIAEFMSEETICFTATVYENGKKIGDAKNDGQGGSTFVYLDRPHSKTYEDEAEIEEKVDELIYAIDAEKQKAKIRKKVERDCIKHVCVGWMNEHGASYWQQGFKSKLPLAEIAKSPKGVEAIQRMVDRIKSELTGDETILNTNLEALGVTV